jgi:D-lactate dehydrogenase (cytochrome)
MIVPFDRLEASLALYRRAFESRGLQYAIWGHLSDGNLHPNVIPRSIDDVVRGQDALTEIADGVIALGGSPLAEHGVGRSPAKQACMRRLVGDRGIDEMRAIKHALDPSSKLAPGVLFSNA